MPKETADSVFDAALNKIATATVECLNTTNPASRAGALSDNLIPDTAPSFTGPSDGASSGRKIQTDQLTGVNADAGGTATHVTLVDASEVLYITTCTSQLITIGNPVTLGAWNVEFADPT